MSILDEIDRNRRKRYRQQNKNRVAASEKAWRDSNREHYLNVKK